MRAELDDAAIPRRAFRYTAYGTLAEHAPLGARPTLLGFAGELTDPSGLIYLRARWYDPAVGRLTVRDPFPGSVVAPISLNLYQYAAARPTMRGDPSGLWTGAICIAASFSAGGYAIYQICPIAVASNGEIGWTATIGSGLSPSLAVSATVGPQFSTGRRISDLAGPFTQVGASAGVGPVGGADWFWSEDASVQGGSASAGFGGRLTGFAPVEVHAATTDTRAGVFINFFDLLRSLFRVGADKRPGG